MRNPRNYSIPQGKISRGACAETQCMSHKKGEPGKFLTRAPCAKIFSGNDAINVSHGIFSKSQKMECDKGRATLLLSCSGAV
jgi:hypothetical protein